MDPLKPGSASSTIPGSGPSAPRLGRIAAIAAVIVIAAAFAGLLPRWHQRESLRAETRELSVPTVVVVSPAAGKAPAGVALSAEVKPFVETPIYARASGYLKRWLVDIGTQVVAGQLLAEIDTPELNQELARARAQLAQSEASLSLAKATAVRWTELAKTESVSQQEAVEKDSDLALKTAMTEGARAEVHRLEELKSFSLVTAPFDGAITFRQTEVGELISPNGGHELFRLAQTGTLRIFVRVPQFAARSMKPGQLAELTVPELPGRIFHSRVVRTAGVMDAPSRTLLVELEQENSSGEILAGSYALVRFTGAKLNAALTLPSNSLLFRAEGAQVGIVSSNGKVELRRVTLGRDFGPTVEIVDGVQPSDRVILNPSDSLASGSTVRVAESARSGRPN